MKKNKRKTPEFKKPFIVLNRRKIAGWAVVIFFLCAWMFVLGVLVGRNRAPVKFDIKKLQQKLDNTKQNARGEEQSEASKDAVVVKDKTKLGFYERLPEDDKDTRLPDIKPSPSKKSSPTQKAETKKAISPKTATEQKKQKKFAGATKTQPSGAVYTIQAASVKNAADADRLVAKLKKKGYPAYRAIGKVPGKGIWFRVRIGEYDSGTEARRTMTKLKKLGLKPILVKK
jgi:cell division septation protein DedD